MTGKNLNPAEESLGTPLAAESPEPTPAETPQPDVPVADVPEDDDAAESQAVFDSADFAEREQRAGGDAVQVLPILPLRGTVVFPQTVVPLAAAQARSLRLIDEVMSGNRSVGVVLQHDSEQEGAGPNEVHQIGVIGTILQMMRVPDGSVRLAIQGNERMEVVDWVAEEPYLVAKVRRMPEDQTDSAEVQALSRN